MELVGAVKRPEQIEFFLRLHGLWEGIIQLPRPPPPPQEFLETRPAERCSQRMKTADNPPDPGKSRRLAEHSSFQHFSFTEISPFVPVSGPAPALLTAFTPKAIS